MLELGEHAEHLQHHPTGWGAGVERLSRRAQHHVQGVQLPFDIADLRVLRLDMTDLYSFVPQMEAWRAELAQYARQALEQPEAAVTPITLLGGLQLLARLEN
ncbi:MAG TPA: hypothetical protein VMD79_11065 [Solirubrobacteraceae bacterium]|nr:hypothetical protein [Solirubrobacteraceae bacterium]